jgi:hypothetical protein
MSSPHPQPEMSTASPAQGSVPNSPPPDAPLSGTAQTVMNLLGHASSAREQLHNAREHISHAREHLSDPSTPGTVLGAAQNVLSRLTSPSAHPHHPHHSQVASYSGTQPLPEMPRDLSAEAPASPATDALAPARGVETTFFPPTSVSSHAGTGGRAITPPTRGSRATRSSYPALPEATHSRPIPVPFGTAYRRSAGPYTDSETVWHANDEREPVRPPSTTYLPSGSWLSHSPASALSSQFREKTVGERVKATIDSAEDELVKASAKGKRFRSSATPLILLTHARIVQQKTQTWPRTLLFPYKFSSVRSPRHLVQH